MSVVRVCWLVLLVACSSGSGLECVVEDGFEYCICPSGNLILGEQACDLENDCFDWADERHCPGARIPNLPCDADSYMCTCNSGNEIYADELCDGTVDCSGGEDERRCWNNDDGDSSGGSSSMGSDTGNIACWDCTYGIPCELYYAPYCYR